MKKTAYDKLDAYLFWAPTLLGSYFMFIDQPLNAIFIAILYLSYRIGILTNTIKWSCEEED